MTFEPRQVGVGAWQEVKGEAMPVNVAGIIADLFQCKNILGEHIR